MKNSWDYKEGDLIEVEKLGWANEVGVIISFRDTGPNVPRKYWEWVGTNGTTRFFFEVSPLLKDTFKVKVLARNTNV